MPVLLPDEPDTVYEESDESAMNTGRFSDEPVAASVIPSITTASDTVPTVAVRTALPVPFTVTIPFSSTEKTESSLLLQSNALSVSDGVTMAVTLNLVPTRTALSSNSISTVDATRPPSDDADD